MNPYMVEVYRYLRDHAKPVSQQDAADLAKVRTFCPPSKGHIHRLKRDRSLFKDKCRAYRPLPPEAVLAREFMKEQKAILGGTRTVAAWTPPLPYTRPMPMLHHEPPARNAELWPERPPLGPTDLQKRTLLQKRLIALGRMLYNQSEPNMFEVLEAFGSWDAYQKALKL